MREQKELRKLREEYNSWEFQEELRRAFPKKVCCNCGRDDRVEYHHIVPLALGGNNVVSNIACLCVECHGMTHGTRNIRKINRNVKRGRKSRVSREIIDTVFDKYVKGELGGADVKRAMKLTGYSNIKDSRAYKEYIARRGIVRTRNNVDMYGRGKKGLPFGEPIGFVEYADGRREDILYRRVQEEAEEFIRSIDDGEEIKPWRREMIYVVQADGDMKKMAVDDWNAELEKRIRREKKTV